MAIDWDAITDEISAEFNELSNGRIIDANDLRIGERQKFQVLKFHPMSWWFPDGYEPEIYQANKAAIYESQKQWRKDNPDAQRAIQKRKNVKHRLKNIEAGKRWRARNPDYSRKWRAANPDAVKAIAQRSRDKNKTLFAAKARDRYWRDKAMEPGS